MDKNKLQSLVMQLYHITDELEAMFPTRHFTLDGHLVGSLGECLVADAYGLELMNASNKGYDAIDKKERKIEIKATQSVNSSQRVAFRHEPDFAIVILILPNGDFEEVYNGTGNLIWQTFKNKSLPSNGQYQISLKKLAELNDQVKDSEKIKRLAASSKKNSAMQANKRS